MVSGINSARNVECMRQVALLGRAMVICGAVTPVVTTAGSGMIGHIAPTATVVASAVAATSHTSGTITGEAATTTIAIAIIVTVKTAIVIVLATACGTAAARRTAAASGAIK